MEDKLNQDIENTINAEVKQSTKKAVDVPEGYYMGTNGVLYPIGTPQFGIATHIAPNATANAERKAKSDKKTGSMVASIILSILAIGFTVLTYWWVLETLNSVGNTEEAAGIITMLIFIFLGPGWISMLPAVILSILGLVYGIKGLHSTSKAIKAWSIISICISSICLLALFFVLSMLLMGPWLS